MNASPEVGRKVLAKIGISIEKAVELCSNTINQSKEPLWYAERSIRITASKFGQIIKRRKNIEPMSILKNIKQTTQKSSNNLPAPLLWGITNEAFALQKYAEVCNVQR